MQNALGGCKDWYRGLEECSEVHWGVPCMLNKTRRRRGGGPYIAWYTQPGMLVQPARHCCPPPPFPASPLPPARAPSPPPFPLPSPPSPPPAPPQTPRSPASSTSRPHGPPAPRGSGARCSAGSTWGGLERDKIGGDWRGIRLEGIGGWLFTAFPTGHQIHEQQGRLGLHTTTAHRLAALLPSPTPTPTHIAHSANLHPPFHLPRHFQHVTSRTPEPLSHPTSPAPLTPLLVSSSNVSTLHPNAPTLHPPTTCYGSSLRHPYP